jgi:cytochrome c peroxidase
VAEYFTRTIAHVRLRPKLTIDSIQTSAGEMTLERLGEQLFHDASLSPQKWQSCSSCHPDGRADGLNWDLLNDGIGNPKNTRSLVNTFDSSPVMWTGVRPSAGYAVRSGMEHILFAEPGEENANAIEAWLRSLKPVPGPIRDRAAVERGRALFHSAAVGCVGCHPPPLYSDGQLRDVGTQGEFDFTDGPGGTRVAQNRFMTPSLVEVWRTAPYLHDGRYATLREVITSGNRGDSRGHTSHLTPAQIDDLLAFLSSL